MLSRVRRGRGVSDEGAVAVEMVGAFAIWIVVMLYLVQFALWWHAKATADTAAREAVYAAKLERARPDDGYRAATIVLTQTGHLQNVVVDVRPSPTTVEVEVRGTAPALVPFGAMAIVSRAQAPLERFVPRSERP
jgi:hypothetical protein